MAHRFGSVIVAAWLAAAPARAQVVEIERSFSVSPDDDVRSVYSLSLPDPLEVPDIANSTQGDPCDLSAVSPDGVVNSDDIICLLWGGGEPAEQFGVFSLMHFGPETCSFVFRTAFRPPWDGKRRFVGGAFDYQQSNGYLVWVRAIAGQPLPENRVLLRSRCEIGLPPVVVQRGCGLHLLALPYDSDYRTADELLCGLEGVDWDPLPGPDGAGSPDRCTEGLFDPISGLSVTVQRFFQGVGPSGRSAFLAGGRVRFIGIDHELFPSDAVFLHIPTGYQDRVWAPQSDPCR